MKLGFVLQLVVDEEGAVESVRVEQRKSGYGLGAKLGAGRAHGDAGWAVGLGESA
jgi:hypothetical protein